jgi:serine/threonine-protein kinase
VRDRLKVVQVLGQGGEGIAVLCRDANLGGARVVAKIVMLGEPGDPEVRRRTVRHVALARQLDGVARVFELAESDDCRPVIIMEHVGGMTLRSVLQRRDGLAPSEAQGWLVGILSALTNLHEAGVVHGDLKPDNVCRTQSGRVKLLDLGLAFPVSGRTRTRSIARTVLAAWSRETAHGMTPFYAAPELVLGAKSIDERADIFALGIIGYECLTGSVPAGRAQPLRDAAPHAPPELVSVIERALAAHPSDRFANARAMLNALAGISPYPMTLSSPVPATSPAPLPAPAAPPMRTSPDAARADVQRARSRVRGAQAALEGLLREEDQLGAEARAGHGTLASARRRLAIAEEVRWAGHDLSRARSELFAAEQRQP